MRPDDSFIQQPIRSLQTMLRILWQDDAKYSAVVPDGIYGPATVRAISAFQRIHELPVTGITDQTTWDMIVKHYLEASVRVGKAQSIEVLMDPGKVYTAQEHSPWIYLLQGMLAALSETYPAIKVPALSGTMDSDTQEAVKKFQDLAGLPANGKLDKITWKNMALQYSLYAHHTELSP